MLDKHDVRRTRNGRTTQGSAPAGRKDTARDTGATASGKTPTIAPHGIKLQRYFTAPGDDGFANVEWELRTAAITGENGKIVFEQRDVEVPKTWTQTATNVVVQKYFRGIVGTPERERSVRQLISRVADTMTAWGKQWKADGYFADEESARDLPRRAQAPAGRRRRWRSTRRSGSTSASRRSRSARPASSTASTTRWTRS